MRKAITISIVWLTASAAFGAYRLVPSQYPTIQAAIDDCNDGDTVIIAPGVYTCDGNRDIDFKGKAITVRSINPLHRDVVASTVIDCQSDAEHPHRGFLFNDWEGPDSVLAGLTITHGHVAGYGGGICCSGSSPTITHCVITNNSAERDRARGGGIYCSSSNATIANCVISGNSCKGPGWSHGGGMCFNEGSPTVSNCIISKNSISGRWMWGSGIYCEGGTPTVTNCTVLLNFVDRTSGSAGEIECQDTDATLRNCIVWGHILDEASCLSASYSDIQDEFEGPGNISISPQFLDSQAEDFRLAPNSPCIDAGDPCYVPEPWETDIYGKPRMMDGRVDMGADEFVSTRVPCLTVFPKALEAVAMEGDPRPDSVVFYVHNSLSDVLRWEVEENCSWLTADPPSGESTGEMDEVTLDLRTSSLPPGNYAYELNVTGEGALNSPQTINLDSTVVGPIIALSATEFEVVTFAGKPRTEERTLGITNAGGGTLNWEIAEDCAWLEVTPVTGECRRGRTADATLTVYTDEMPAGAYLCELTVSDPEAENSPQTVKLFLYLNPGSGELHVPSAFPTIQAAVNASRSGDVIVMAPGAYAGEGNRDIDFEGRYVTVQSIDPNDPNIVASTVIDCNGTYWEPHRAFYSEQSGAATIHGLTITNGYASHGGGIYCGDGWLTVTNCTFTGNLASGGGSGGGIYCIDTWAVISDCTFTDNWAGSGGAVYCGGEESLIVANCTFCDNSANSSGGGIQCDCLQMKVTSSLFKSNSARLTGGGVYTNCHYRPVLTNCTFGYNSAGYGGGLYSDSRDIGIVNCIFWGNIDSTGVHEYAQIDARSPDVTHCCIYDGDPNDDYTPFGWEASNIDDDPLFVRYPDDGGDGWGIGDNDDFGDLHLRGSSPCINAGVLPADYAPYSTDMDGQPRIIGFRIDIGADEATPLVAISRPRGGEVWVSGSRHEIAWENYDFDGAVDIRFSDDQGDTWETLAHNVPNVGGTAVYLPEGVDSDTCMMLAVPNDPNLDIANIESGAFTVHPDSPGPPVQSKWKSLGGDFGRTGLSENHGPELGCIKWEFKMHPAVWGSPTIGFDGRVHIACDDGRLYTLDRDGALLCSYETDSPLLSSPTIGPDGTVYVGGDEGRLYAIDIDGNLRWTHDCDGTVYSSPAASEDGDVYVCSDRGTMYALGQDGSNLWSFQIKRPGRVPIGAILASPTIARDGTVYIGGVYDPNLYALDPIDGSIRWTCSFESGDGLFASPVVAPDGTIYQTLLDDTHLHAVEPETGAVLWSTDLLDPNCGWFDAEQVEEYEYADGWSEPALGPDGTIYVNLLDPFLRAVEPNGKIKWVRQLGMMGGFMLTVGSDGLIYATSDDGYLCVVEPGGREVARFETDRWLSFPAIQADGTIIVADTMDDSAWITDANNTVWAISTQCAGGQTLDLHRPEDLDGSGTVDLVDLDLLAANWLLSTDPYPVEPDAKLYPTGDVDRDFYVELTDLALIGPAWRVGE